MLFVFFGSKNSRRERRKRRENWRRGGRGGGRGGGEEGVGEVGSGVFVFFEMSCSFLVIEEEDGGGGGGRRRGEEGEWRGRERKEDGREVVNEIGGGGKVFGRLFNE